MPRIDIHRLSIPHRNKQPQTFLRARRARRRGAATLELAVVAPFLCVLALGTVDFGRFGKTWITVTNAARSGAYYASGTAAQSTDQTGIRNAVLQDLKTVEGASPSDVTVSSLTGTDSEGYALVSVTVTAPFKTLFHFPSDGVTLSRTTQMRIRPDQSRSDGK